VAGGEGGGEGGSIVREGVPTRWPQKNKRRGGALIHSLPPMPPPEIRQVRNLAGARFSGSIEATERCRLTRTRFGPSAVHAKKGFVPFLLVHIPSLLVLPGKPGTWSHILGVG
jgi:hypothetical protein